MRVRLLLARVMRLMRGVVLGSLYPLLGRIDDGHASSIVGIVARIARRVQQCAGLLRPAQRVLPLVPQEAQQWPRGARDRALIHVEEDAPRVSRHV